MEGKTASKQQQREFELELPRWLVCDSTDELWRTKTQLSVSANDMYTVRVFVLLACVCVNAFMRMCMRANNVDVFRMVHNY